MFSNKLDYIDKILKDNGYEMTIQRKLIIKAFLDKPYKHFTPKELYQYLKETDKSMGLATIYRNIKLLKQYDIIEEIIHEGKKLYELKLFGKKSFHVHCYCTNCNAIKNFAKISTTLEIISKVNKIEDEYEFKIEKVNILFNCICKNCKSIQ